MTILALDSTASPASAALLKDEQLAGEYFINIKCTHSQTLMPMVESLLNMTNTNLESIDVFAVNAGPGSFTGVRIGVAAIKGMAMALNKPCAAVSTLESLAYSSALFDGIVCAVMDARRSQVYNAVFEIEKGCVKRLTEDRAVFVDELKDELLTKYRGIKTTVVGDGTDVFMRAFEKCPKNIFAAPLNLRFQRASGIVAAAQTIARENKLVDADELMPIYLRLPQAQRELLKKQEDMERKNEL